MLSHFSCIFVTLWTVACQAPLSMGFSGVGFHALLQGLFSTQGSNHVSCVSCIGRQILYLCTTWEAGVMRMGLLQSVEGFSGKRLTS